MRELIENIETRPGNPLDIIEQYAIDNEWPFERASEEELTAGLSGGWCDYHLWFLWRDDIQALQFSCAYDVKIPGARRGELFTLLSRINDSLPFGHYNLWKDDGVLMFRHTLLLRGTPGVCAEQLEDLLNTAVAENERYFPALQYVLWGGKTPDEAVELAMLETAGMA